MRMSFTSRSFCKDWVSPVGSPSTTRPRRESNKANRKLERCLEEERWLKGKVEEESLTQQRSWKQQAEMIDHQPKTKVGMLQILTGKENGLQGD